MPDLVAHPVIEALARSDWRICVILVVSFISWKISAVFGIKTLLLDPFEMSWYKKQKVVSIIEDATTWITAGFIMIEGAS